MKRCSTAPRLSPPPSPEAGWARPIRFAQPCEGITDRKFDVGKMMNEFVEKGGVILACGTCLRIRNKSGTELCPTSTMQDLVDLTVQSDKVLTFG